MARRSFSTDLKREAASLVLDQNYRVTEACTAMGVGPTAMRRWVEQLQHGRRNPVRPSRLDPSLQIPLERVEFAGPGGAPIG